MGEAPEFINCIIHNQSFLRETKKSLSRSTIDLSFCAVNRLSPLPHARLVHFFYILDGEKKKLSNVLLIEPLKLQSLSLPDKCKLLPSLLTYAMRGRHEYISRIFTCASRSSGAKQPRKKKIRNEKFAFLSIFHPSMVPFAIIINEFII